MNIIVVGVDHSAGARAALAFAHEEARLRDATLRVVHAWQFGYIGYSGFEVGGARVRRRHPETPRGGSRGTRSDIAGSDPRPRRRERGAAARRRLRGRRSGRRVARCDAARRRLARARRLCAAPPRLRQPAMRTARRVPGRDRPVEAGGKVTMAGRAVPCRSGRRAAATRTSSSSSSTTSSRSPSSATTFAGS